MSNPAYPRYKDSGFEWLGQIPDHWTVERLKRLATVFPSNVDKHTRDGEVPIRLCNYTDVYYGDQITNDLALMEATATTEQVERFTLRSGDVIITKDSETSDDIAVPAYVPKDLPGVVCGYHLSMVRPRDMVHGRFIRWSFEAASIKAQANVCSNGLTRVGLGQYAIDNLCFPCPLLDEQKSIAAFLDSETAKIDALIKEQHRLIDLLDEDRTASVANLVLGGVHLKKVSSEVDWIGNVPSHWSVTRICNLFTESVELGGDDLPVLSVSIHDGVSDKELNDDEVDRKVNRSEDRGKYKRVRPRDLVYNMMRAWQGGFGSVEVDGLVSPAYVVARPKSNISTKYVESVLRTRNAIAEMKSRSRGVTDFRLRLYWEEFRDVRIPVPPSDEQVAILKQIGLIDLRVDELKLEASKLIELLVERRRSLITAAVTGKIDVRGFVAPEAQ